MRLGRSLSRALALPTALGLSVALLTTSGNAAPLPTHTVSAAASASSRAAANAALDAASRRDVGARESLRLARAKVPPAQKAAAHRRAILVRATAALNRARHANPAAASAYDAASAAVHRAQAAFNTANRSAASSAARLRSAQKTRHAADVAAAHAAAAVRAARRAVDEHTATSTDLIAAVATLARAKAAQSRAHRAYKTAAAWARHDRAARSHAATAAHTAAARLRRLAATEPRGLAAARSYAAQAGAANRHATSILQARRLRVQRATSNARSAAAAFRKATAAALAAVSSVARSTDCPAGNVFAGAPNKHVMSAPGLTITRYKKPGRAPIWVTSANLAGPGAQIRPGPLMAPHVTDRTTQADQLAGSHALAAVNGDFFNIEKDNSPWGAEVNPGGVVVKGSAAPESKALVIARTGLAQIGYLGFDITVHQGTASVAANSLNSAELPKNGIAVLTSRWGSASRGYLNPTQAVYEYVVTRRGVVSAVHTHLTSTAIPAGGMVIVAQGSGRDRMREAGIHGSAKVSVSTRSQSAVPGGMYSAIGVGEVLIRDGIDAKLPCSGDSLHARTLVGIKPGGQELFVVTAQGQTAATPSDVGGLTFRQAQGLMRSLGAYDAAMFDGGGSTLLTARIGKSYKMVSRPTGAVRPIPNNLAFWPR